MTFVHRPRVILAVLAAVLVLSVAAPGVDARLPRARPYRVGGPITLDTNLLSVSGVSAWSIDEYLKATTSLPPLGASFLAAEQEYGVNARFLLAVALHESGWGRSYISRVKHNLFGYNAFDRNPARYASAYATYAASIDATARFMRDAYLTRGGRYWLGQPTLRSMQEYWSSSGSWGVSISRMATSIRLHSLIGRSITFAAPVLSGPLHGGDPAFVDLAWTGRALPAGVEFVATWEPIELDSEVSATTTSSVPVDGLGSVEAAPGPGAPSGPPVAIEGPSAPEATGPTSVAARRVESRSGSMRLTVAAPAEPGDYMLDIEMRDAGSRPLPAAERVEIPNVQARVWSDRAVSYDVEPSPNGIDAIVRITNTGRLPVPAVSAPVAHDAADPAARSIVTVTVSSYDPVPAPVLIVASPLPTDLLPGASLVVSVPGIDGATAGRPSVVSVDFSVLGDSTWLRVHPPAVGWSSAPALPAASPDASETPTLTPALSVTPVPPATPAPTPSSPPAPSVTRSYAEHDAAIAYGGTWGDASDRGYAGGNAAWSRTGGSTATFTFTGSSVSWIGPVGPTRGRARVLVDGQVVARVDLWRSTFVAQRVLFARSFGSSARHTLTIEVISTPSHPYVAIDGFVVRS